MSGIAEEDLYGTAFALSPVKLPDPSTLSNSGVQRIVDRQLEKYNVSIPGRTTPIGPQSTAGYTPPGYVPPATSKKVKPALELNEIVDFDLIDCCISRPRWHHNCVMRFAD